MSSILTVFLGIAITYTVVVFSVYILLTFRAVKVERIKTNNSKLYDRTDKVSIMIASYNEDRVILDTLNSIKSQDYQSEIEVIVVDDGSDIPLHKVISQEFNLTSYKNSIKGIENGLNKSNLHTFNEESFCSIVDKYHIFRGKTNNGNRFTIKLITMGGNSGKAHCLNVALTQVKSKYIYTIDADTRLTSNAVSSTMNSFKEDCSALSAMVGIEDREIQKGHSPKNILNMIQFLEYLRSFILWKTSLGDKDASMVVTGAFALFRTSNVREVGGWKETLGEDMELTWDILEKNEKVQAHSEVLAYTQAPDNVRDLGKQRVRWFRGGHSNMINHRNMLFSKNVRSEISNKLIPFLWFADILGPIIELTGYSLLVIFTLIGNPIHVQGIFYVYLLVFVLHVFQMLVLLYHTYPRVVKECVDKRWRLILMVILEPLTYHYLHFYWMVKAHLQNYLGTKKKWNKLERR